MDQQELERMELDPESETPEDVAVLYSWANLQGAKYRDFSASRREYRAQMRHRAAELQRTEEVRAQAEAEAAAAEAERAAREAEEAARFHEQAARTARESSGGRALETEVEEAAQARAIRAAAELARKAAVDRIEAARRAEAVAAAEAASKREEREMAEAHASALRQAQRYQESEVRRRSAAGPQPIPIVGGEITDPYNMDLQVTRPDRIFHQPLLSDEDMQPSRFHSRETRIIVPQPDPTHVNIVPEYRAAGSLQEDAAIAAEAAATRTAAATGPVRFYDPAPEERRRTDITNAGDPAPPLPRRPQGYRPDEASSVRVPLVDQRQAAEGSVPAWIYSRPPEAAVPDRPALDRALPERYAPEPPALDRGMLDRGTLDMPAQERFAAEPVQVRPSSSAPLPPQSYQSLSPVEDTLLHSRERVAARWYALKGVFEGGAEPLQDAPLQRAKEVRAPMLTVFSLAGGVGKTSLVATLGRTLSSAGERVLLTDTTSHGLLPFYFGASELRPGVVRTFSPPEGSSDAPIYLVSYDVNGKAGDATAQDWLSDELSKNGRGMQRILLDLTPSASWVARRLVRMNSTVLVPVAPDMNSVISLQAVEKFFAGMVDGDGRPVQPFYLLNQFDSSLPLHLDVREVMRQQLGDQLLPFVIRRSQSVSEALAEGMTVMDYAPDAAVAGDYITLASWLRTQAAPANSGMKNARWSER